MNPPEATPNGATAVITHRVHDGRHTEYEAWMREISPLCQASPGYLDWQIIRPIAGLTESYTIVIRFTTNETLRQWMSSRDRQRLIDKVRPLLVQDDDYTIHTGLDFWFTPVGGPAKVPVRWKQVLVTWSAIYPLVLVVPPIVIGVFDRLHLPDNRYVTTMVVSTLLVSLMVYVIMPRYTRWVRHWLYR